MIKKFNLLLPKILWYCFFNHISCRNMYFHKYLRRLRHLKFGFNGPNINDCVDPFMGETLPSEYFCCLPFNILLHFNSILESNFTRFQRKNWTPFLNENLNSSSSSNLSDRKKFRLILCSYQEWLRGLE